MTKEELEKEAEEKYCKGCKLRMEQCLWAWRKTNGLNEPNEKNCSCKKVPAYIAGAEPREKRIEELIALINAERERQEKCDDVHLRKIAELEKENAELKTKKVPQLERRIASIRGSHSVDVKKLNARIEQVERLKKENAELKEQCSILADCNTCVSDCKTENIEIKKQLTKAKSILEEICNAIPSSVAEYIKEPLKKAEQFLKDSEVEK